jgi:uncharacterized membrane protein YraQ (UPF0718 family)
LLSIFTKLANWLAYSVFGLEPGSKLGGTVQFFIEDSTKTFFLLVAMIYCIALIGASLNIERVRDYLAGKNRFIGYFMGSIFGAITPFCSCSSIPVFLEFTSGGIPIGITMSFLLTSALINEVAVLLLLGLVGWKITMIYVVVGMTVGIAGGIFLDLNRAEKLLQPFALKAYQSAKPVDNENKERPKLVMKDRHDFAKRELLDILAPVWKWIFIGLGLGAARHGYVPTAWIKRISEADNGGRFQRQFFLEFHTTQMPLA